MLKIKLVLYIFLVLLFLPIILLLFYENTHFPLWRDTPNAVLTFLENVDEYDRINDKIIEFSKSMIKDKKNLTLYVSTEDDTVTMVKLIMDYKSSVVVDSLTDNDLSLLTKLNELVGYNLEFISYDVDRVSYHGIGGKEFVYTVNNRPPSYFFYDDDDVPFTTYKVCNNWFYLVQRKR